MSRGKGKIGNPSTKPPGETHRKPRKKVYGDGTADRLDHHASNPRTVKKRREGLRKAEYEHKAR